MSIYEKQVRFSLGCGSGPGSSFRECQLLTLKPTMVERLQEG